MTHCIKSVPIVLDKKLPILLRPEVRNRVCYPQLEERVWETGKESHTTYWCRKSPQLAPWRIRSKKCRSPLSGTKICAGQFIWTSLKIICQQRGSETYRRHHARRSLRSGYVRNRSNPTDRALANAKCHTKLERRWRKRCRWSYDSPCNNNRQPGLIDNAEAFGCNVNPSKCRLTKMKTVGNVPTR